MKTIFHKNKNPTHLNDRYEVPPVLAQHVLGGVHVRVGGVGLLVPGAARVILLRHDAGLQAELLLQVGVEPRPVVGVQLETVQLYRQPGVRV